MDLAPRTGGNLLWSVDCLLVNPRVFGHTKECWAEKGRPANIIATYARVEDALSEMRLEPSNGGGCATSRFRLNLRAAHPAPPPPPWRRRRGRRVGISPRPPTPVPPPPRRPWSPTTQGPALSIRPRSHGEVNDYAIWAQARPADDPQRARRLASYRVPDLALFRRPAGHQVKTGEAPDAAPMRR